MLSNLLDTTIFVQCFKLFFSYLLHRALQSVKEKRTLAYLICVIECMASGVLSLEFLYCTLFDLGMKRIQIHQYFVFLLWFLTRESIISISVPCRTFGSSDVIPGHVPGKIKHVLIENGWTLLSLTSVSNSGWISVVLGQRQQDCWICSILFSSSILVFVFLLVLSH